MGIVSWITLRTEIMPTVQEACLLGAGRLEVLIDYLRYKSLLLVLDNFEHLMEGAELLPAIMQAAPGVQILVTSRELLNLQAEWVFVVEGLPYPLTSEENRLEQVEAYGAVQLFLQSALRVNPSDGGTGSYVCYQ